MKAIVYTQYGPPDVLEVKEVEKPTPEDDEVLIRIQAASVNAADKVLLRGKPFLVRLMGFGLLKPRYRILGADVAGRVEAVGRNVAQFQPGDAVFGNVSECGWGGFAEYTCAREDALVLKPASMAFEDVAAVPMAAVAALRGLRDAGRIQPGQKVLVNGASGGLGTFAVQIAKVFGAEVTAVCSTRNLEMVRSIGADHVVDYTQDDFTKGERHYDLILDAAAYRSVFACMQALSHNGVYVLVGGSAVRLLQVQVVGPMLSMTGSKRMTTLMAKPTQQDLIFVKELLEEGKVVPVIDRRYELDGTAPALRYLEDGHTQGKVVITLHREDST